MDFDFFLLFSFLHFLRSCKKVVWRIRAFGFSESLLFFPMAKTQTKTRPESQLSTVNQRK